MSEISQTRQLSPRVDKKAVSTPRFPSRILLAAAAALILLAGVVVVTLPGSDDDRISEVVESSDAVAVPLQAQVEGQQGELRVVWSDELDQVVIEGMDLPDPGEGLAYALWFLLDDGVAPAGLFTPEDGSVTTVLDVDDLPTNGWGISIEPDTGSEQPTSAVLFAGTIETA